MVDNDDDRIQEQKKSKSVLFFICDIYFVFIKTQKYKNIFIKIKLNKRFWNYKKKGFNETIKLQNF